MEYTISGGLILVGCFTLVCVVALIADAVKGRDKLIAKDAMLAEVAAQRDDWKQKAEELLDAALVRTGAIHQPTMVKRPKADVTSMLERISSSMAVTEIDSSKQRKAATS